MTEEETQAFANENDLLYNGVSSAQSDTNIREVVEALMESKMVLYIAKYIYRDSQCLALS